jgi:TetR/AcrR family transcriptional regulator
MSATTAANNDAPRRRPGRPPVDSSEGVVETRELILRQAERLFMQRGFAAVSVGDVAEAVGVTKPTLYYHFGYKEGLYAAMLVALMTRVGAHIRRVTLLAAPVPERLEALAFGYFGNADATMEPMLRDTEQLIGPERAASVWAAYEQEMLAPMMALMRAGIESSEIRDGDERILARAFCSLLDAFSTQGGHATAPDSASAAASPEEVARAVTSLFLDGAAPRNQPSESKRARVL